MTAPKNRVQSDLSDLREDLGSLRDDIKSLVVALRDAGESSVRRAGRNASRAAENGVAAVKDVASTVGEKVGDQASAMEETARESIQSHPWWSVFGAVGVGLLVGRFLDRR